MAKAITKEHAKTFYFASLFLDKPKRRAAYSVYAFCRLVDDAVDESQNGVDRLCQMESFLDMAYENTPTLDPLLCAIRKSILDYKIDRSYFDDLISGVRMDLEKNRFLNFNEIRDYSHYVAGVIGLIMLQIFGFSDEKAKDCAVDMGIAMQLTNILRDIHEDFLMDRIYLPKDEMEMFGLTESDIRDSKMTPKIIQFLQFQIERARSIYVVSEKGVWLIDGKRSRLVALAMSRIYAQILGAIEDNDYNIFEKRVSVGSVKKLIILTNVLREVMLSSKKPK
ncbi:MAG: phytoene/squalene synthase family protein [Actinomycetota bacterium]|nr:phytoene/squalene synthase family protein [Actinomycetota bacterium]